MKYKIAVTILAVLVLARLIAAFLLESRLALTPASLREFLLQWGFWKAAVLYFIIYSCSIRPFVPMPPTILTLAGGVVFGPLTGTALTVLGATANASITFLIGRRLGYDWLDRRLGERWKPIRATLQGGGFKTLLLIRLTPVGPPFDLVSYAAGILGIRFRDYFWGTLLGIVPATGAYSYLGGTLRTEVNSALAAVFGLAMAAIALPWIWKKWRGKADPS